MRCNEDLAMLAKGGNREAMAELWEQNTGLLFMLMSRFFPLCARHGLTEEDLRQECYFALLRAIASYDPNKGLLLASYLSYHIRNVAQEALGGRRRKGTPPLIVSLDEPVPGTENCTIGDIIKDESAEAAIDKVQIDWLREQLQACLDDCLFQLKPEQRDTIRSRYFEGKKLREIAETDGVSVANVRQREQAGLRALRRSSYKTGLHTFLEDSSCHGYGLTAFRNRGFVSRVEVLAGVG